MENTLENKTKFFAQYYGQKIFICPINEDNNVQKVGATYLTKYGVNIRALKLTNIVDITDDDCKGVSDLCGGAKSVSAGREILCAIFGKEVFKNRYACNPPIKYVGQICDYLRLKSYCIPYNGISINKLIEYGWVKLTTN